MAKRKTRQAKVKQVTKLPAPVLNFHMETYAIFGNGRRAALVKVLYQSASSYSIRRGLRE